MLKATFNHSIVFEKLIQPLGELLSNCRHTHQCPQLPDADWLAIGLCRALRPDASGRAFLQFFNETTDLPLKRTGFFESLKSPRRLRLTQELLGRVAQVMSQQRSDPFADFPALKAFTVWAGDGHWHTAAVHDRHPDGKKYPVGHLFTLDLRTQALGHLTVGDQVNRKKEHDMRALKRLPVLTLRQDAPKGRKVLYVWDKAGIDFVQWHRWKQQGIYFISRQKENMKLEVSAERPVDSTQPINQGVLQDEWVSGGQGVLVRRVIYHCPVQNVTFEFLTNEMTLEPGLIALLYKRRWDLEKVFDELKNRLMEKKAWASSATAKTIQAHFLCLLHNLMVLLEAKVEREEGIRNEPELARRAKRLAQAQEQVEPQGEKLPLVYRALQRLTQRGVKWIRWLCNHLFGTVSWAQALAALRRIYQSI
jgi:hypothetical protein